LLHGQNYYFTTIAGQTGVAGASDGTNGDALFTRPSELALDANGCLYVSDTLNHTIRKITPVGNNWVVTTIAGLPGVSGSVDGTNNNARFYSPNGLAFDQTGNLFVADHNNHTIRKIMIQGTNAAVTTIAGFPEVYGLEDGTNSDARFRIPTGIAVDVLGRIFVVDTANFTIRMVTPAGTNWIVTTIAGTPLVYGFSDGLNGAAAFNFPYGIATGPDGALFVTDAGNYAIRRITEVAKGWDVATVANSRGEMGSYDGPARFATFNLPNGIALDAATNIYVADQSNHTLRKLTYTGHAWDVTTIGGQAGVPGAADGMGTNALFRMPWGLVVDNHGAIFVADAYNHTIRRGVPAIMLQVVAVNNKVVVSWPVAPAGFQLERTVSLSAPDLWETVTQGIVLTGDRYAFTNDAIAGGTFYRLKR
jgi:sugar lactone lactonase YvrE